MDTLTAACRAGGTMAPRGGQRWRWRELALLLTLVCVVMMVGRAMWVLTDDVALGGSRVLKRRFVLSQRLPRWSPAVDGDGVSWDLFFTCTPESCFRHAQTMPASWWQEVAASGFRVVYVVGGAQGWAEATRRLAVEVPDVHELPVCVMATTTEKEEYPPVRKEMDMLRQFATESEADALFVHVDTDVVLSPSRLAPLLLQIDRHADDVYLGRPISSCECNQRELPCTFKRATRSCSGFFYITTRATLARLPPETFAPAPNGTSATCRSSDLSVGYLMSRVGLQCSPLRDASLPQKHKYPGVTWPIGPNDKRFTMRLPICQQIGSPGGIHVQRTVTVPWWMDAHHRAECVVFHPAKRPHDVQFAWNLLHNGGDVSSAADMEPHDRGDLARCTMGIMVPTLPGAFDRRQVVRLTWGQSARAYGVRVLFVVGKPTAGSGRDMASLRHALALEEAMHGDILAVDVEEGYRNMPFKVGAAMRDMASLQCGYFAKVDPDSYFRPYQALKMLEVQELVHSAALPAALSPGATGPRLLPELYVGHIWDARKAGKPNVVKDPASPWYMGIRGDYYPPYASGYAQVLSAPLWRRVAACMADVERAGSDDVLIGMCVERVSLAHTHVVHPDEMRFDAPCTDATVADNPVCSSSPYNLLQRHEANLRGDFCALGKRQFLHGGRSYGLGVDPFALDAAGADRRHMYLAVVVAPWQRPPSNPDVFVFEDETRAEHGAVHGNSNHVAVVDGLVRKLNRKPDEVVRSYQCVGCLGDWHLAVHMRKDLKQGRAAQPLAIGANLAASFGTHRTFTRAFDVGILSDCRTGLVAWVRRLKAFAKTKAWDMRLIVTLVGCTPNEGVQGVDMAAEVRRQVVAASHFPEGKVAVVGTAGAGGVQLACQSLHGAARPDATLVVLSTAVEVKEPLFIHAEAFVEPGRTAYFPVVFSRYKPSHVSAVRTFYNTKSLSPDLRGRWRDSSVNFYAIAGTDAAADWSWDQFGTVYDMVASKLHILRFRDLGIQLDYQVPPSCKPALDAGDIKRLRACVGAAGTYSTSTLALYLAHELPEVGLTPQDLQGLQ